MFGSRRICPLTYAPRLAISANDCCPVFAPARSHLGKCFRSQSPGQNKMYFKKHRQEKREKKISL